MSAHLFRLLGRGLFRLALLGRRRRDPSTDRRRLHQHLNLGRADLGGRRWLLLGLRPLRTVLGPRRRLVLVQEADVRLVVALPANDYRKGSAVKIRKCWE